METLLQVIAHHPNPKIRMIFTIVFSIIGFFGGYVKFLGPGWILSGLQGCSLMMLIVINYPAFKKRIIIIFQNFQKKPNNGHK